MKIIRERNNLVFKITGHQKIKTDSNYRKFTYIYTEPVAEGLLLYNNFTEELVLIENNEIELIDSFDLSSDTVRYLINNWFFVDDCFDDYKFLNQIENTIAIINNSFKKNYFDIFTILTTTECNARCFYCYERDRKKYPMSKQTALDVADFIIAKSNGNDVDIKWFGGEPLYNKEVIDVICTKLTDSNINFKSSIISNGYLFDIDTIKHAKKNWNLKKVQITLDGTESKYNKIKNFIYEGVNCFQIVISNIKHLIENDIYVTIRMNMDFHNAENLFELVEFLYSKFKGSKYINVYSQLLFDESGPKQANRSDVERIELKNKHIELKQFIISKGFDKVETLSRYRNSNHCMADLDNAVVISPDGHLGKCEHFSDSHFWGSIYSNEIDYQEIVSFKKRVTICDDCKTCNLKPSCDNLDLCPDRFKNCNEAIRFEYNFFLKNRILSTYNKFINMEKNLEN